MTSHFPDDPIHGNATFSEQAADVDARPQPGMIYDGDDRAGGGGAQVNWVGVAIFTLAALVLVGLVGGAIFFLITHKANLGQDVTPASSDATGEPGVATSSAADMYDKYIAMIDDESIFLIVPRTDEGWAYLSAFVYKLADYKAAETIGGPLDQETVDEMLALEARLLALQDLEMTVDITRADGTEFHHDGKPPTAAEPTPSP